MKNISKKRKNLKISKIFASTFLIISLLLSQTLPLNLSISYAQESPETIEESPASEPNPEVTVQEIPESEMQEEDNTQQEDIFKKDLGFDVQTVVNADSDQNSNESEEESSSSDGNEESEQNPETENISSGVVLEVNENATESGTEFLSEEQNDQNNSIVEASTAETTINETEEVHTTSIVTGDSVAIASILNLINTNLINSNGVISILNNLFGDIGTIDLRNLPFFEESLAKNTEENCNDIFCQALGNVDIINENEGMLTNSLIVRAISGGNEIITDENGEISTGDAYAVADIVNIVNSNIVDSNYAMLVINNFGDWFGDFVFPGFEQFNNFFSGNSFGGTSTNTNEGSVTNNVLIDSDTGENKVQANNSNIDTGNAVSVLNIINSLNNNLTGGNSLAVIFRIHGDWLGEEHNLPEGVIWDESDGAISIYLDPEYFGGGSGKGNNVGISNNNNAIIDNNVEVYALTGENQIDAGGNAQITTGNAYAAANILNIANTNVISQNWLYAIVNIFGDWHGDLHFGLPDIWVGGIIENDGSQLEPGALLTYTYTVANRGDAPATNVLFETILDNPYISFIDQDGNLSSTFSRIIDYIGPGESEEISLKAVVSKDAPNNQLVENEFNADSDENDEDKENNSDTVTITVNQKTTTRSGSSGKVSSETKTSSNLPTFEIDKKVVGSTKVTAPSEVNYQIKIYNDSSVSTHNTVLVDVLTDEEGNIINKEEWNLGRIWPHEEITIDYSMEFGAEVKAGTYTNHAKIFATQTSKTNSQSLETKSVSTNVEVINDIGEVLGVETCTQYINNHIKAGSKDNNPKDIVKLQEFLNDHENSNLLVDGNFNQSTITAVKGFQTKYASEILDPWGIKNPTGNVYYTTQKKINELYCNGIQEFPLSETQQQEIDAYYALAKPSPKKQESLPEVVITSPVTSITPISEEKIEEKIIDTDQTQIKQETKKKSTFRGIFNKIFNGFSTVLPYISLQ